MLRRCWMPSSFLQVNISPSQIPLYATEAIKKQKSPFSKSYQKCWYACTPLRMAKIKSIDQVMVMCSYWMSHTTVVGRWNRREMMKNSLTISYTLKHTFTVQVSITLLGIYPREMKRYVHTTNLYVNVHSKFIYKSPKLEQSTCLSVGKPIVYAYSGILFSRKIYIYIYLGGSQGHYAQWKKPTSKSYIFRPFCKWKNQREASGCRAKGWGKMWL